MDAIRNELLTGEATHGRGHIQKGRDMLRGLDKWLRHNPHASESDRQLARSLMEELKEAFGR